MIQPIRKRRFPSPRRWIAAALCLLVTGLITIDAKRAQPHDDSLLHLRSGILIVGMDPSNPPFADGRNGEPIGLDVDVIHAVAARLGVTVQIRGLGFDGLYDALKVGAVDVLISALAVDPAQLGDVRYCGGYFDAGARIVSAAGAHYAKMPDLEGRTVAVEYGSAADETARLWQRRLHRLDEEPFPTVGEALDTLAAGTVDAAIVGTVDARLYVGSHPGLSVSAESVAPQPYVMVVRGSSRQLAERINAAVADLTQDGTLDRIIARWLGGS